MQGKTVAASRTIQTQIVLQSHANGSSRLFGGQLMAWMDVTGAVAARRHSGCDVVTASVDRMNFVTSARINDIVVLEAHLTYVGKTSMEVCITADVEAQSGLRKRVCISHYIFVAVDWEGKPTPVPPLLAQSEEERCEQATAAERWRKRREERSQG